MEIAWIWVVVLFLLWAAKDSTWNYWLHLSGEDPAKLSAIARKLNEGRRWKPFTPLWFADHQVEGRWMHIPVYLPIIVGLPVIRIIPLTMVWFIYNLVYKFKYKGRGWLWQVPRYKVINHLMRSRDETL